MSLFNYIKPLLKEDSDLKEVESKITEAVTLTKDKVKEWVDLPENKSVWDYIAQKAVETHKEKEAAERKEWETAKASELLEEAKKQISKEQQKTPEQLEIEELKQRVNNTEKEKAEATLRANLSSIVTKEKLNVHNIDLFVPYGEKAEEMLREHAKANAELIESSVKTVLTEKYDHKMPGDDKDDADDKPMDTVDFLKQQLKT